MANEATVGTAAPVQPTASQGESTSQASTENQSGTAQAQSPDNKPLAAPLIKDPAEFLARARARNGFKPEAKPASGNPSNASGTASNESSAKPSGSATPQSQSTNSQGNGESHGDTTHAAEGSASSTSATTTEPPDDLAARVAKFSREQRELSAQREAFKAEQAKAKAEREAAAKQHEERLRQAETVEKAAKAIESGDIAGALKALKSDVNPSAIALQLLEQLQREDERPMSQAEVDRIVSEKLKAQEEARAKAEEEARKKAEEDAKAAQMTTLEGARDKYMGACLQVFSKDKHPFIAASGLDRATVFNYVDAQYNSQGVPPDPEEVLTHFETLFRKRAEAAGWAPKTVEAPKPAPSPSFSQTALTQDSGGRLTEPKKPDPLNVIRENLKRDLRVAFGRH